MAELVNKRLLLKRAVQPWQPQSGIEESQGAPYKFLPGDVTERLQIPGDPGINLKGWVNPYKLTYYGVQVPDQATDVSIVGLAGNFRRSYLSIQNKGPGNLFVNFGVEANFDGTNCLQLVVTQFFEFVGGGGVFPDGNSILATNFVPRDSVYVLSDLPGTTCVIGEGIWTMSGPAGPGMTGA